MVKPKYLFIALAVLVAATWKLLPHDSEQDKAYYVSLYCLQPTDTPQQALARMQQTIENNNQDYALKKRHFSASQAQLVLNEWQRLTPEQQRQAQQRESCTQLLSEKLHLAQP